MKGRVSQTLLIRLVFAAAQSLELALNCIQDPGGRASVQMVCVVLYLGADHLKADWKAALSVNG